MSRRRGQIAEATGANIFISFGDGKLHTPTPDCFLNGITRQTVIGMLKDRQIKVHERHIMPEELEGFEQCWLTGTAAEVTPVREVDDRPVGDGRPGPVTRRAQQMFMDTVTGKNERHEDWLEYI